MIVAPAIIATALASALQGSSPAHATDAAPLTVVGKIPLGKIQGRIDHLAFDPTRKRLYVAELGNNSIGILDLNAHRVIRTVRGISEPQGIAYEPSTDAVYVASGGDGSVRIFRARDFAALGRIPLGDDADNVRVDQPARLVYVGYGEGALAVIDPTTQTKVADIPLRGHPESFQISFARSDIFVNVPDAGEVAVVSKRALQQVASWPTGDLRSNYAMALDSATGALIAVFRRPARLEEFDLRSGRRLRSIDTCADSDDVFVDSVRHRVYVICGEGFVDTLYASTGKYSRVGRSRIPEGSRTGLYVPELDCLFVAIRASPKESAAVWMLRASP